MRQQQQLFEQRFDLSHRPVVMMSGGRKASARGRAGQARAVRELDSLARITSDEIRTRGLLPLGFTPLPHVKHATGAQDFQTSKSMKCKPGGPRPPAL
jgi:hypothetical protein